MFMILKSRKPHIHITLLLANFQLHHLRYINLQPSRSFVLNSTNEFISPSLLKIDSMFSSQAITVTLLLALAPGVWSVVVRGEAGYAPLNAKRLTCASDEQACGDICISTSDECCDHYYYCGSGYTCGHGGECCNSDYNSCSLIGTYVYCKSKSPTRTLFYFFYHV